MCRNVGNSYPTPFLRVYVVYMRVYIVQQFTVFTENVEKASLFLSETCLHKLSNTNAVILYKIVRYWKDLGIAGYLPHSSRIPRWSAPAKWKILPRLCGLVKYVLTSWSCIQKSLKSCRHFGTCVPNCLVVISEGMDHNDKGLYFGC